MIEQEEILVVDDTPIILNLLTKILSAEGFQVRSTDNGALALDLIAAKPPQLILLDINMPKMDGFEVCRQLKLKEESKSIPVIFVSGSPNLGEKVRSFGLGAVDFISKPFQREELLARVRTHLELNQLRTKLETRVLERTAQLYQLAEELKKRLERLNKTLGGIIQAITLTVETRDPYTAGQQRRVADLARAIAQEMGLSDEQMDGLHMAGLIHDLGKISIPAEILNKPTKLNEPEFNLIKGHSEAGYE
ncbi:MAG: response regulator, partial [Pseudomonadota bacterium]